LNFDQSDLFAVLGVAGVGALYHAAGLRGNFSEKWSTRVDLAEAALAERATTEALRLQEEIAGLISTSPPRLATVDPSPLAKRAAEFQKTLIVGNRLPSYLRWLLRLCPIAIATAVAFLLAVIALFFNHDEIISSEILRIGGLVLGGLSLLSGAILLGAYIYLDQALSGAEIRSHEEVK
jgi:hypothetical protein